MKSQQTLNLFLKKIIIVITNDWRATWNWLFYSFLKDFRILNEKNFNNVGIFTTSIGFAVKIVSQCEFEGDSPLCRESVVDSPKQKFVTCVSLTESLLISLFWKMINFVLI